MFSGHLFFQYPFCILVCFSSVYGQRFMQLHGEPELTAEDGLLKVARGQVVVVIEAHFSPADTAGMGHGLDTERKD